MENKPMVVDVKIKQLPVASCQLSEGQTAIQASAQCSHVRADGLRCGRRAASGREECEWHGDWNFQMMPHTGLPYPEDAISIQHVLAQTMGMMLNRHITPEQARAVAVLCRELRQNLARFEWEMKRYQLISGEEPGKAGAPYLP
jgi:hypothetical protein